MEQKIEKVSNQNTEKEQNQKSEQNQEKPRIRVKVIILVVILLIALVSGLAIVYGTKVVYYRSHYFPNTFINGMDCSELDTVTTAQMLYAQAQEYSLKIVGRDEEGNSVELGIIRADKIALEPENSLAAAEDVLNQQDEMRWLEVYSDEIYSYSVVQGISFDEELLKKELESMEAFQTDNMSAPMDARIGEYVEEKNAYELVPETLGNQLDMDTVFVSVAAAIYGNASDVDLVEHNCYISPAMTTESEELLSKLQEVNNWLKTDILFDWNGSEVKLDNNVIKEWISVQDSTPILDEEAVMAFIDENANKYDTYGKSRKFMTTLGVELSLPSGAFGWKTDREGEKAELIKLIKQGYVGEKEPLYDSQAPQKGMNDIGSSYVEADLSNQHLYLYYKGNLVLETDFVSGNMTLSGCITPQGVFGLTYKTTNAVLRGQDYETPVSYWMPFHGNFGMHDASWRTEFGGDIFLTNGSHGCLNLPVDKAAEIYNYVYTGYPVICYYY